jgi:phosphohistidine phosphatase
MRHAKSSWRDATVPDHDRPLNGRGRAAAADVGTHLRERGLAPDVVLCSTARRARETLERSGLATGDVELRDDLYGADDEALLAAIRSAPPATSSLAVIAHDPGIHDLAVALTSSDDRTGILRERFPTGAVAVFDVDGRWSELAPASVRLTDLVRPRDLA